MNSVSFSLADGILRRDGLVIDTPLPVLQAIALDEKVIALLEFGRGKTRNDNVLCYDGDGELLWKIQESPHGGTKTNPYVFIGKNSEEQVVARASHGVEYEVSAADGQISAVGFRRF